LAEREIAGEVAKKLLCRSAAKRQKAPKEYLQRTGAGKR
jgi:hypothetical protein